MIDRSPADVDSADMPAPRRLAVRLVASSRRSRLRTQTVRTSSLLPVIGADDVILPSFDEKLGAFAIRAQQDDREARDALYVAFLPKLTRMSMSVRAPYAPPGSEGIWNRDDVAQEAYLVFLELVDMWSGDVSFTAFVLSRFSWRLRDVIHRGIGKPSVPPRRIVTPMEEAELMADGGVGWEEPAAMLDALIAGMPEPLKTVLIAHIVDGKTQTEIAHALGVSRRTVVRYWHEVRHRTIALMAEDVRASHD